MKGDGGMVNGRSGIGGDETGPGGGGPQIRADEEKNGKKQAEGKLPSSADFQKKKRGQPPGAMNRFYDISLNRRKSKCVEKRFCRDGELRAEAGLGREAQRHMGLWSGRG